MRAQMLQVAGRKGDTKLGALSFSAELAVRKAAAAGLGSSGETQAEDRLKATRHGIPFSPAHTMHSHRAPGGCHRRTAALHWVAWQQSVSVRIMAAA